MATYIDPAAIKKAKKTGCTASGVSFTPFSDCRFKEPVNEAAFCKAFGLYKSFTSSRFVNQTEENVGLGVAKEVCVSNRTSIVYRCSLRIDKHVEPSFALPDKGQKIS